VKTKFSKSFATWFFPVGEDIRRIVVDWVTYLRQEKLWSLDDPLFPATKIVVGDSRHLLEVSKKTTATIRTRIL
jgi:integrase/recombinase XerD